MADEPQSQTPPETVPTDPPAETPPQFPSPPAGRPLKFKSVDELSTKIEEYFGNCDPHVEERLVLKERSNGDTYSAFKKIITEQEPYTITGLARALKTTRDTLLDYESGKYDHHDMDSETNQLFSDTIREAKMRCAEYAEKRLFLGNPGGPIFNLTNNHGWVNKTEVLNKNQVADDLDALDDRVDINEEKADVAEQAAKSLEETNGPGSKTGEQVVATQPPVQDPK